MRHNGGLEAGMCCNTEGKEMKKEKWKMKNRLARTARAPFFIFHFSFLLLIMLVPRAATAQTAAVFDTCVTFEDAPMSGLPTGWSSTRGADFSGHSSSDAIVGWLGHNSQRELNFSANNDVYVAMPCMSLNFAEGAYIQFWAKGGGVLEVGTMTDPNDATTFHPLATFIMPGGIEWRRFGADLTAAPVGDCYIAFHKVTSQNSVIQYIDDIRVMSSGCLMWDLHIANEGAWIVDDTVMVPLPPCDTAVPPVVFEWRAIGDPDMVFAVGSAGSSQTLRDTVSGGTDGQPSFKSIRIEEGVPYTVSVSAICDNDGGGCSTTSLNNAYIIKTVRPECDSGACVDTRLLFSSKATPYYGTFEDPYTTIGAIDYGPGAAESRHTVNTDTSMLDAVVGYLLRVIPPGEDHSVRLGNRLHGAEAEAMQYDIPVDTNQFDMLILKYAAVMQDPGHSPDEQPRFRIEMLDSAGTLIEPAHCNSYDFVANWNLGWNTMPYGTDLVLWKDWTVVGVDLSAYHGQTVKLRLTTYDCLLGAHFGYAYYTISCARRGIGWLSCTVGDSNLVEAPEGFNYRWHRDDSDSTIGTSRIISLPADDHRYYCELGFIGDPTCSVPLSVRSRMVLPVSDFDYTVQRDSCRFKVTFIDRSHYSDDTATRCDSIAWQFGDTQPTSLRNPIVYYPDTGSYPVRMVSSIPIGNCHDTLDRIIHLMLDSDTIEATICLLDSIPFGDSSVSTPGYHTWQPHCDSLNVLDLTVLDTSLIDTAVTVCFSYDFFDTTLYLSGDYDAVLSNADGCDSTVRLHLAVNPVFDTVDSVVICPDHPYLYLGVDYGGPTEFDTLLYTTEGCDSAVHVLLLPRDTAFALHALHSIDRLQWADTVPVVLCEGQTLYVVDSTDGTVDWLWGSGGDTVRAQQAQFQFDSAGSAVSVAHYSLALQTVDRHGCIDSLRWPVVVFPPPEASFAWTPDNPVDVSPEIQFINYTQPGWPDAGHPNFDIAMRWLWLVEDGEGSGSYDSIEAFEPVYRWQEELPSGERDVRLVALRTMLHDTLLHTCADTAQHTIEIITAWLAFPNVVSPNGDGVNDRWVVVNLVELGLYPMNELWIYDVWGVEMYHARNISRYEDFWDPNDGNCPDGTYYYRFMARSAYGIVRRNGVIEVIR